MKFDCGETWQEKHKRLSDWHRWFAWHPVKLFFRLSIRDWSDSQPSWVKISYESDYVLAYRWVWFKRIYRREAWRLEHSCYEYFDGDLFDLMRLNGQEV